MRRALRTLGFGLVTALAAAAAPVDGAAQASHVLVVVGLGGTAEYRDAFHRQAASLRTALVERHGVPESSVVVLSERVETDPQLIDDRSTKENVLGTLSRFANEAGPSDRILVVLIGHGSSGSGGDSFNLPGPDVVPGDFAAAFAGFPSQPVAFVHTGSGSGAFLEPLSGENRIVITATRTGRELNATHFGEHFVAALSGDGADIDRDGSVSLLEAYTYARQEVARQYEADNEMLTEHAMLDDDGDGEGAHEADPSSGDGSLAARFAFGGRATAAGDTPNTDDPVLQRLYGERSEIQEQIDELRALEGTMEEELYLERMEELLVELALKNREIRAAGGEGPPGGGGP